MATTIPGDVTTVVPIVYRNGGGQPTGAPTGDTVTVHNDNAEVIGATVEEDGTGNRSLVITPAQPPQAGAMASIQVHDVLSDGTTMTTTAETFEVAAPAVAQKSMELNLGALTTRPLPSRGGARVTIGR